MALNVESSLFLVFSLLDFLPVLCMSSALCPHTAFYHDCWIRRFPGLFLSFSVSEQRGARVLQRHPEPSAHLCSRKCCDQESCNVAVFYAEVSVGTINCHLVHCPHPDSCLVQVHERSILFTVTAGVDPDLLVFEKLGHVDFNLRSSLKWNRVNISQTHSSSAPTSPQVHPTEERHTNQASSSPYIVSTPSPADSSPEESPTQPPSPADSPLRSFPPTLYPPQTPSHLVSESARYSPSGDRSHVGGELGTKDFLPSSPPLGKPMTDVESPAHLDSSKQHLNETKGHVGRNHSSDAEGEDTGDLSTNLWALPVLIGSAVTLLCCCSGILALGCCRMRRRGRYKPGRARSTARGTLIRWTLLKDKD
ncbi:PREDICTED: MANSC domain-containing protein 4 [Nanorana parkeri]|uniref:MANSC domain-containing protein 4 n=1 Tax=Nanorana parkeri TaxID=125878 RepID=UPI000854F4B2|nr:PREDICTED: MANSC domain-containing protein 4 [Nanorana parkeri]